MNRRVIDFVLLAALWGGSFLFMRIGAPEFGPVPLIAIRLAIAAACLWPLFLWAEGRVGVRQIEKHKLALTLVGVFNSALPFTLLSWATLSLTAGFTSLINASTPMWTAVLGALLFAQKLRRKQWLGLLIGAIGMVVLTWGKVSFKAGGSGLAIFAALGATLSYGYIVHYAKRALVGVSPLAVALGSQTAAALLMLPLAFFFWPAELPSLKAWGAVLGLAVLCTSWAYILYYRIMARSGGQVAATVTFLVPVFAGLWGVLFLNEPITVQMWTGGAVVLIGTALALGVLETFIGLKWPKKRQI